MPPVVEPGGAGVGVAGEALYVLERHALGEQVGDDGDAEGVRRELGGQGSVAEAAFHHAGDIVGGEAAVAEPSGLAKGSPEQRCIRRRILESGRSEVGGEDFFKIAADRDLPRPAAFFGEAELSLTVHLGEVAAAQLRHGAGAGGSVGEQRKHGAVAAGDGGFGVDRCEQPAGLGDGDLRGLALDRGVALAAHRQRRVEQDGVAADQGVEEMPQGGQVQLAGSDREVFLAQLVEVLADVLRRNALERQAALLASCEEALDRRAVGVAGVLIAKGGVEELLGREDGRRSGLADERRQIRRRWGQGGAGNQGLGGIGQGLYLGYHNILYWALFAAVELATSMVKLSDTFLRMAKGEIGLDDLDVQVQ